MKKQLHQYEITFDLKKRYVSLKNSRYENEYGFGFNPPAIIHAKSLKYAWEKARKLCPKDCKITSVRRDFSDDYMATHIPEDYNKEGKYIG